MPAPTPRRRLVGATAAALLSLGCLALPAASAHAEPLPPATTPGTAVPFGIDQWGQSQAPAALQGRDVVSASAGSYHDLALTSDGKVTLWGSDWGGWAVPASLDDQRVTAVSAGYMADLALTSRGSVVAWGRNFGGVLDVPTSLSGKRVVAISAGWYHELALTSEGEVVAWGDNSRGESTVPASLDGKRVVAIEAGEDYQSMALTSDGEIVAWGNNAAGTTSVPSSLSGKTVTAIALGHSHALALTSDGTVTSWGSNGDGDLTVPAALDGQHVTAIAAGYAQSLALTTDGTVVGWGASGYGEDRPPAGLTGVTSISAGNLASVAVSGGGTTVPSDFTTAPVASISGTPEVGTPLTAIDDASPEPDQRTYRWFADGHEVLGATGQQFTPGDAEEGAAITAEVTSDKVGFLPATSLSQPTEPVVHTPVVTPPVVTPPVGTPPVVTPPVVTPPVVTPPVDTPPVVTPPVAASPAPRVHLSVDSTVLRRGQSTRLRWTSADASTLTATSGWSGHRASSGTLAVRPTRLGTTTYELRGTNTHGTTTARVAVRVVRAAKVLPVAAGRGLRLTGTRLPVAASGLDVGEAYDVRVGGVRVATGHAGRSGEAHRNVVVPTSLRQGRTAVTVTGSESDRRGSTPIRVVAPERLGLSLAHSRVRASDSQRYVVRGLAAGERVTVTYQGRRVSPRHAHAGSGGTYAGAFGVHTVWGTRTVRATGQFASRSAGRTFEVVRRCTCS